MKRMHTEQEIKNLAQDVLDGSSVAADVGELKTTVGDADSGLVKDVSDNAASITEILTEDITKTGDLSVTGDVVATTFEQTAYNYSQVLNFGGNVTNIYSIINVKNKTLEVIVNVKFVNDTDDAIIQWGITSAFPVLPEDIASKIVDYNGKTVHDSSDVTQYSIIAVAPCFYCSGPLHVSHNYHAGDTVLVLYNVTTQNQIGIGISKSTNAQITVPAHTTYYFTARVTLDIM